MEGGEATKSKNAMVLEATQKLQATKHPFSLQSLQSMSRGTKSRQK
jgi:hypothetical protein